MTEGLSWFLAIVDYVSLVVIIMTFCRKATGG